MSDHKLPRAVLRLDIPLSPRTVLLFLVGCATEPDAPRFPKRSTIAAELHITERTVKHCLNYLELAGLIHAAGGRRGGRGKATAWLLDVERIVNGRLEPVPSIRKRGKQGNTEKGETGAHVAPFTAPEKGETCAPSIAIRDSSIQESEANASDWWPTPPPEPEPVQLDIEDAVAAKTPCPTAGAPGSSERGASPSPETGFEEFYRAYPRHKKPAEARRAYVAARRKVSHAVIMEGVQRFLLETKDEPMKYLPYPASWLNGECWADEPDLDRMEKTDAQQRHNTARDELKRGIAGAFGDCLEPGSGGPPGGYRAAAGRAW